MSDEVASTIPLAFRQVCPLPPPSRAPFPGTRRVYTNLMSVEITERTYRQTALQHKNDHPFAYGSGRHFGSPKSDPSAGLGLPESDPGFLGG